MTQPPFTLRPQADIEAELLRALDELCAAEPIEERVSWWGGRAVALLWALGADELEAIGAMYQTWQERDRQYGED